MIAEMAMMMTKISQSDETVVATQPKTLPGVAEWCNASALLALLMSSGPKMIPKKKKPMTPKISDLSLYFWPWKYSAELFC
jgi:hypothetical protein